MRKNKTWAKQPTKFKKKVNVLARDFKVLVVVLIIASSVIGISSTQVERMIDRINLNQVKAQEPGKELSVKDYVLGEVTKAGLDPYEAYILITTCENPTWNPDKHVVNNDKYHSIDRGIFMINSYWHKEVSNLCAYDYKCNTREAIRIRLQDGNWHQWTCAKKIGIK